MPDDGAVLGELIHWELTLPSQVERRETRAQPERTLIFEVLASALHDLRTPPSITIRGRTIRNPLYHEAREWVIAGNAGYLTCRDCCDWLGLNWEVLRDKVEQGLRIASIRRQNLSGHEVQVNGRHKETGWSYDAIARRFRPAGRQQMAKPLDIFSKPDSGE